MVRLDNFSIRLRITLLAVVPLIGLVATAGAVWLGQTGAREAFERYETYAGFAIDAQRVRARVQEMRASVMAYVDRKEKPAVATFENARDRAVARLQSLQAIAASAGVGADVTALKAQIGQADMEFIGVQATLERLGLDENSGLNKSLAESVRQLEVLARRAATDFDDGAGILEAVLRMRRHERDFALRRSEDDLTAFREVRQRFTMELARAVIAPSMKQDLQRNAELYFPSFDAWVSGTRSVTNVATAMDRRLITLVETVGKLAEAADGNQISAKGRLDEALAMTSRMVGAIVLGAILICCLFGIFLARSITYQLGGIAGAMRALAGGDTAAVVPSTDAKDQIGEMARAVLVFRGNAIERERLTAEQAGESAAREQRAAAIDTMIKHFEANADRALGAVREVSGALDEASAALTAVSSETARGAQNATTAVDQASGSVASVAAAAEELSASIREISGQALRSSQVAERAVGEAGRTAETMNRLARSASRIGEVVGLIQAIAGQTNLLALNATIEAARVGEAGKGFAVVASEVKSLAAQTAKATEEIASQIGAIQDASGDAVTAIAAVGDVIEEMRATAGAVAASVEEQNSAVSTIAASVHQATSEATSGAAAIGRVGANAARANHTANEVGQLSAALAEAARTLDADIRGFLGQVRAA